jgi:signal transduction histidine kinase/ABC-type branched-subunit amino acid transport system ATPase component
MLDPGGVGAPVGLVAPPVLRVRDLHKRFGHVEVLRGVDLEVFEGEILCLVGENGTGKSTVVQCIARTQQPDSGAVEVGGDILASDPVVARDQGVAVVWQDLALCDNLSALANLFLGDERSDRLKLDERWMAVEATALLASLRLDHLDMHQPVSRLSGGQRQLVAIARAVRLRPRVLILDEPTASLGVTETAVVEKLVSQLRAAGTAILLVSHRLDQVFELADRIAVLRDGRILATSARLEVHPDDVVALMSGVATVSAARRQLGRLHSLVEQLADVEPAATLPLIASAMAEALGVDQLCVHLLDDRGDRSLLRRSATVGLRPREVAILELLEVGAGGGPAGLAAATAETVVVEDTRHDPRWEPLRRAGFDPSRSSWSVPIVGTGGVLGTISGYADSVARPQADQLELVSLYASHAAAAIERERLLADATRRNRMLETLRGVLDKLAGPQTAEVGLEVALVALCRGLGADAIALHHADGRRSDFATGVIDEQSIADAAQRQAQAAAAVLRLSGRLDRARPVGLDVLAVPISAPSGRSVVTAWWADTSMLTNDALDLLDDAARSLQLALEREAFERANAEAASLRRSQRLQRDFLSRLNHELRTPLTAIQGYASTLQQTDVDWDESAQQRFLGSIADESARMGRLVGDLLDFSAIDSGTLRLARDWSSIELVLEAAQRCITDDPGALIEIAAAPDLPPVWADHDRLEQVFVNLLDNATRHATGATRITASAVVDGPDTVAVRVVDDGCGISREVIDTAFVPRVRGATPRPGAGLGLAIARGIVDAHGGSIRIEETAIGTTVAVVLPIDPPDVDDVDVDPVAPAQATPEPTGAP